VLVRTRTRTCAICAWDVHAIEHGAVLASDPGGCLVFDPARDLVLGHEYRAERSDYGPQTEPRLARGTRVTAAPVIVTAPGPRAVGLCDEYPGGFGELMLLQESLLHPVADHVGDEIASLVEPLSTGGADDVGHRTSVPGGFVRVPGWTAGRSRGEAEA
jgi:threonine dehydrogenase-like Zn-dependent dehydrogenase